jgi:hypothetical protein
VLVAIFEHFRANGFDRSGTELQPMVCEVNAG